MKANKKELQKPNITDELLFIKEQNNGLLDPVKVVEFARNESTALHSRFEWDDTEAAERYRIWQARMVIRMELTIIPGDTREKSVRAYVSLLDDRRAENDSGYRCMLEVLTDSDLREQLLEEAKKEMLFFRRKFSQLSELSKVFEAMDEVHSRKRSHG